MKDFVNKIHIKLTPIIVNRVDYYTYLGQVDRYELTRYNVVKVFYSPFDKYKVRIELVNGYKISIDVLTTSDSIYKTLMVRVLSPAVKKVRQDDGCVDVYPTIYIKEHLQFVECNFDIESGDWGTEIQDLMDKYILEDKADVEVIE